MTQFFTYDELTWPETAVLQNLLNSLREDGFTSIAN